jgi:hypothetical protein
MKVAQTGYYARNRITHVDGTAVFQTEADREHERDTAARLEQAWRCRIRSFGALAPVDWYAERDGRLIGVVELKARPHASTRYPTVYLNVRKWLALGLAATGLGCPAILVVRLSDGLFWVSLSEIDAGCHRISGCMTIVKSTTDIEPIIEIPIAILRRVTT